MAYASMFRPAVLLFFFIREPVAATALVGGWAFWEIDRNCNLGVRESFNNWRNNELGFPTKEKQLEAFDKIDQLKRQELLLKEQQ